MLKRQAFEFQKTQLCSLLLQECSRLKHMIHLHMHTSVYTHMFNEAHYTNVSLQYHCSIKVIPLCSKYFTFSAPAFQHFTVNHSLDMCLMVLHRMTCSDYINWIICNTWLTTIKSSFNTAPDNRVIRESGMKICSINKKKKKRSCLDVLSSQGCCNIAQKFVLSNYTLNFFIIKNSSKSWICFNLLLLR